MEGEKKTSGNKKQKGHLSASFVTGAIALVFLIIGYQAALFVHKAAVAKIESDRDRPDTVFVIDKNLARTILSDVSSCKASAIERGGKDFVAIRKDAIHTEGVESMRSAYSGHRAESFRFDPNSVSPEDLQRLGFSPKQSQAIVNYRNKGGRFHRKGDFAKSFVVADSTYRRLEPYIDIPKLDINAADSADFDRLPGIGKYFASKMVSYRRRLGGYSYKEQLMDIYHFDKMKYDALSDLITVNENTLRPYKLWSLPEDLLKLHPYVGSFSAHGIVLFRKNNPKSEWTVENMEKAGILNPDFARKLSLCVIEKP